ncbi:PRP21 [[Candida] subhashii]|uniref:PRP21 n=1 Tax=[Candida] subhashii TaxID=561895 RepID=A0A8J5QUV2_9ASCO|nr:PRP21 [[Candida] subhashii]KAG7665257.1 PRP21 [[Candida] subhashii]
MSVQSATEVPKDIKVPPKDIKETVDKTVAYVNKNGKSFEQRLLANNTANKFDFILEDNEYHSYYKWKLNTSQDSAPLNIEPDGSNEIKIEKPRELPFLVDLPSVISSRDLDIIKTTALYIAHNGIDRIPKLLQHEEKRNNRAQFEFLNKSHSLHPLFMSFVTQYQLLIKLYNNDPETQPIRESLNINNKFDILTQAYDRAQYIKQNKVKEKKEQESQEQKQRHFASIDWQDFVLVGQVEFDAIDEVKELSIPLKRSDLLSRSLEARSKDVVLPKSDAPRPQAKEESEPQKEQEEKAGEPQTVPVQQAPKGVLKGMKIKEAGASRLKKRSSPMADTIKCPITGKLIPEADFDTHIKTLLRDPRYKQEQENYIKKNFKYASNITTDQVYENIKRLMKKRGGGEERNGNKRLQS